MSRLQEVLGPGHEACYIRKTLIMTHVFKHPKYWAELRKIYKQAETDKQAASYQQASRVSSTVDHDPRAIDEQAKPSLKSS